MKKKISAILSLMLILLMSVSVLAACDSDAGNPSSESLPEGVTIGVGDNIFTEDITLEQLSDALKNADNLTVKAGCNVKYWENGVSYYFSGESLFCIDRTNGTLFRRDSEFESSYMTAPVGIERYFFTDNDTFYTVCFENYRETEQEDGSYTYELNPDGEFVFQYAEKSDNPFYEYDYVEYVIEELLSMLVMKDGKLALADEDDGDYKLDLNGTEITISYTNTYYDEEGNLSETVYYYTIQGVNATSIEISEEIKAYKDQA